MKVLLTEISSIINSTFDCPFHSFRDNFPAILNVLLFFLIKYPPKSLSTALKAIDFIVVPSLPIKTIAFNAVENDLGAYLLKNNNKIFNIAGKLSLNEWKGQSNVEFIIDDISVNKTLKNTVPSSIG